MKLGRQRNYHKGRAATLGCKLYCAMVPASRDRDNVTHWGWRHRATEDGWRSLSMTCRPPQFYALDLAEITVCLCKTKSPVSLCLPIFASLETTTQCAIELGPEVIKGLLYRVPQKYRPKVNGFRSHPVHVFLHFGTFCPVVLLIIASKL